MVSYRLSENAKADLIRIHQYGVRLYGEQKADDYYSNFFKRFEQIAAQPYSYQAVDHIREGYRQSVCGVDTIYFRISADDVVEIMAILGHQNRVTWL